MNISTRQRDGVTILDLQGKMTLGSGETALRSGLQDALAGGATKIVINLKGVTTIDSTGVGELVGTYTTVTNRGAKLKLAVLPPKLQDILTITQLITVFDVYETEDEAVRSF
ncbi:MAG TPA: STAS domain-containing protein [Thermoanaerobaculia bacterium]|nr:STAS domain-containing protein [Thermoanaerobaculia bacterium]